MLYPWNNLKKPGDEFFYPDLAEKVRNAAASICRYHGWKLKVKKVAGGCIVRRSSMSTQIAVIKPRLPMPNGLNMEPGTWRVLSDSVFPSAKTAGSSAQ